MILILLLEIQNRSRPHRLGAPLSKKRLDFSQKTTLQRRMLSTSLTRLTLGASVVPRLTPVLVSAHLNLNLAPIITPICALHTSDVVERARQSTRIRKKKINDANKKKKEERLRKNPPPIPKKVKIKPTHFITTLVPRCN